MLIVFTVEAKRDLDDLRAYLAPVAPAGLANVVAALEARILSIADNPEMGRPSPLADVREAIETRYGFLIPYLVRDDRLYIPRVYRSTRRPLDYASLDIP